MRATASRRTSAGRGSASSSVNVGSATASASAHSVTQPSPASQAAFDQQIEASSSWSQPACAWASGRHRATRAGSSSGPSASRKRFCKAIRWARASAGFAGSTGSSGGNSAGPAGRGGATPLTTATTGPPTGDGSSARAPDRPPPLTGFASPSPRMPKFVGSKSVRVTGVGVSGRDAGAR